MLRQATTVWFLSSNPNQTILTVANMQHIEHIFVDAIGNIDMLMFHNLYILF